MSKYAMSKYFAAGHGHAIRFHDSSTVLIYWNGKSDGAARYVEHVKRYVRSGIEHKSLAALFRAIEAEHQRVDA